MGIKYGSTLLKTRPRPLRETEAILFSLLFYNFLFTAYKDVILSSGFIIGKYSIPILKGAITLSINLYLIQAPFIYCPFSF